jgi:hypothetical protein
MHRKATTSLGLLLVLLLTSFLRAEDPPAGRAAPPDEQQMQKWWDDLAKPEPACSRALLKFAGHPDQSVAFFKEQLKPLTIEAADVRSLIKDLDSDEENVWRPAFERLEYFDPRLAIDLPTLMKENVEPRSRNRLIEVLCSIKPDSFRGRTIILRGTDDGYNFSDNRASWWAEHRIGRLGSGTWENGKPKWTRACRAIVLLEHVASPDAIAILREMSTGHDDAEPTKVAREALAKLEPAEK